MANFWKVVNRVIEDSNTLIEVLDARLPFETRNYELERKVVASGKILILVVNKCDLVSKEFLDKLKTELEKDFPTIYVSSTEHLGPTQLRQKIMRYTKRPAKIGVIGYPNTGKSSIINLLRGKGVVKTSSSSGFTRGKQLITVAKGILLIDTPGVLPFREKDEMKHALIATTNPEKVKDPDLVAEHIINFFEQNAKAEFEKYYGIKITNNTLEELAIKRKMLKKGEDPDIDKISRVIIQDWQKGKIILK